MYVAASNQNGTFGDSSSLWGSHPRIVYANSIIVHTNSSIVHEIVAVIAGAVSEG